MNDESAPASPVLVGLRRLCGWGAAGVAACILLGWLGRFHWAAELFVHYQMHYAAALAVLATAFAVVRSSRGVLVCVVLLTLPAYRVGSLYVGAPNEGGEKALRVVTFNVLESNDRHGEVMDWLEETGADVVLLCEADNRWQASLREIEAVFPHVLRERGRGSLSYMFLSRFPIEEAIQIQGSGFQPLLKCTLETPQGRMTVIGVHPVPPVSPSYAKRHRAYLQLLYHHASTSEAPTLILGDFNATRWASGIQPLFEAGFHDTSLGFGYDATWMRHTGVLAIPIDHVLTRRMPRPIKRYVGPGLGSDHSPVVVDFPGWGRED